MVFHRARISWDRMLLEGPGNGEIKRDVYESDQEYEEGQMGDDED